MAGQESLEFSLSLDVIASKVLLVGLVDGEGAEEMESQTTTDIKGNGVLSAIVEESLES